MEHLRTESIFGMYVLWKMLNRAVYDIFKRPGDERCESALGWVCYDGPKTHPSKLLFWEVCEDLGLSHSDLKKRIRNKLRKKERPYTNIMENAMDFLYPSRRKDEQNLPGLKVVECEQLSERLAKYLNGREWWRRG